MHGRLDRLGEFVLRPLALANVHISVDQEWHVIDADDSALAQYRAVLSRLGAPDRFVLDDAVFISAPQLL